MQCYHLLNILPTICSNLSNDLYSKYIYIAMLILGRLLSRNALLCVICNPNYINPWPLLIKDVHSRNHLNETHTELKAVLSHTRSVSIH